MIKLNIQSAPKNLKELEELVGKIVDVRMGNSDIMRLPYAGLVDGEHEFLTQEYLFDAKTNNHGWTDCIEGWRINCNLKFFHGSICVQETPIKSFRYEPNSPGYDERLKIMKENERWHKSKIN